MRIAIVSYMGFDGAGVKHAHYFANRLVAAGHDVLFLLNGACDTVELMADSPKYALTEVSFRHGLLSPVTRRAVEEFSPEIVHIWTPRHVPARVGIDVAVHHAARLVIHFEDDEEFVLRHFSGNTRFCEDDLELFRLFLDEELDAARLEEIAGKLDTEFLRVTALDPPSWAWIHPIVSAVAMRFADASTVISSAYREYLRELNGDRPSHLLYPGVDHERFMKAAGDSRLAAELGVEDRKVFLYSGTIADIHDFTSFMKAMPPVVRDHPESVLVQVGRNTIPGITDRMIAELGIEDHVVFTGAVPHHRMPEYLALADVFLAPVRPDDFNAHRLPAKIPEYMAVGRPMLIADHTFGLELEQGTEVEKVESDSPDEVADAMRRLLADPARWPAMGRRLRARSRELFDWDANTDRLIDFYEEILVETAEEIPEGFDEENVAITLERTGYVAGAASRTIARRNPATRADGPPRVIIFTDAQVGKRMSGTGIRYWEIARALSDHCDVALGHRYDDAVEGDGFEVFRWDPRNAAPSLQLAETADVVVVHAFVLEKLPGLADIDARIVADLYCPFLFENLELHADRGTSLEERESIHSNDLRVLLDQLRVGNYFLCCTDRQRSWIAGMLTALNLLRPATTGNRPGIDDLVGLVPFGLPQDPPGPPPAERVLKGSMPGVAEDDLVLLWGGGIWSWLDADTVVRAMARVGEQRSDVKLVFLSTVPAEEDLIETPVLAATLDLAEKLGVRGGPVVFNTRGYIEYDRRLGYFQEADVGVCAHYASLETYLAFRTRVLDYLHCGLPIITSRGDHFGDLVEKEELGFAIAPGDVDGWTEAILRLVGDDQLRERCSERSRSLRELYTWPRVIRPLLDYCQDAGRVGLVRTARDAPPIRSISPPGGIAPLPAESPPRIHGDLAERSERELFAIVRREIQTLKSRLSETRQHAASLDARYKEALETLRVVEIQLDAIKKIPFAQRIWHLIKKLRYPHLK